MKAQIFIYGVIGKDTNLLDVIRQLKSQDNPSEVEVIIDSIGGSVSEGQSIYSYLRNLNLPITTIATRAYSIAATIFMAGDTRLVEDGASKIMIHFPWAEVAGHAERLEEVASKLRGIEQEFIQFYSVYTSIDKETIKNLLQKETFLSSQEAVDMGFATEVVVPLQAVALLGDSLDDEEEEDNTNKENKNMSKETEIQAIVIQDANGVEVNFYELVDGAEPTIGDKAKIGEQPADGEITSNTGEVWVFVNGELTEIKPVEEEEVIEEEEEVVVEETVAQEVITEPSQVTEMLERLLNLENKVQALNDEKIIKDAELVALKASLESLKETSKELSDVRAELKSLKELIGSEEVIVAQTETRVKKQSNMNSLTNILRG